MVGTVKPLEAIDVPGPPHHEDLAPRSCLFFCVRRRVFETIEAEVEKSSFKRKGVSTQSPLCTKRTAAVLFAGGPEVFRDVA